MISQHRPPPPPQLRPAPRERRAWAGLDGDQTACCLLALLDTSCCWWPLLGIALAVLLAAAAGFTQM